MYIPISQRKEETNQPVSQGYIPVSQGQIDISNVSKRYTPISQGSVTPKVDSGVTPKQSQPLSISFDFSDEIKNQTAMSTPQIGTGVDTLGAIKKTAQFGAEALQMSARGFLSAGLTIAKKINPEVANLTTEDLQRTVGQFYEKKPGYLSLGLDTEQRKLFGESLFETVFGKKEEVDKWAKPLENVIADTELKLKDWQSQLIEQTKQAKLNPIEKTVIDTLVNVNPKILAFPAVMGSLGLDMFPVGSLEKNVVKTIIKTGTEKEALIFAKRIGLVAEDAIKIAPKIVEADTVEKANEVIKQIYLLAKDRNISIPEIRDFETALQKVETPSQVTRIAEGESEVIPISKINTVTEDFTTALKGVDTKTELPKSKLPILVKKMSDGTYDILDGNHRLAQSIRQGKTNILAITDENIYRQLADKESQFQVTVKSHDRFGTKGVREYTRSIPSKLETADQVIFDRTKQEIQSNFKTIFGKDIPLESVIDSSKMSNPNALGEVADNTVRLLENNTSLSEVVANHEGWHWFKRNLSEEKLLELNKLEKEFASENIDLIEALKSKGYKGDDVLAEELMADEFAKFTRTGKTFSEKAKLFFERLWESLKNIFSKKGEVLNEFRNVRKTLEQFSVDKPRLDMPVVYKKTPQVIYDELSNISKSIKLSELVGTSEEKYQEVKIAIELVKESIEQLPGKQLMKYVSKTTGRLPEVTGQKTMRSLTGSEKLVKRGRFGQMGDELVTELGFNNLDEAQEGLEIYQNAKRRLAQLEDTAKQLRVEKSNVKKGERLMQLAMEDRRIAYRAVKNAFDLTESELSKIRQGRDIMAMSKKEFDQFIERAQTLAQTLQQTREARIGLESTIHELDLRKWENVRDAMKLPPISEMNVEQINKLNDILSKYKTGDEFLPVRQLETIDQTELKGIRTTREALEHLAKKYNLTVEQLPREIKPHPWMYDTQLARSHPLFDLLVNKYNESYLKAGGRTIELERKADDLIKKARNSVPKGIGEMVAPTDKKIIEWLESENRQIVAREMTSEQLQAAEYMDSVYKEYYDWLSKRELEKKFVTRFEDKYFPHIQRGFLETWKEDGFLKAFKQSFDEFKNNEKYLTILDEKTGNILPYQKWVGFTQFRKGGLVPTQNASKAFKAYVTALEKARQFDEFIPEIMVYVHSLTPKGLTPRGIELNDSVNRFIKTWINSKKGRVEKQIVKPGSKLDWALRMGVALTRIRDLGLNIPVGIANIFGEQAGNLTMLGAKNYALGLSRLATKRGREIITKYPEFVGRSVFEKLSEASNTIGDKLLTGLFGLFSQASRKGNQVFLLGSMTADEFSKGVISVERLAQLRKAMGKYRVVEGSESVFGKTVEGTIGGQYKRWAIPILTSTKDNARQFVSLIKTKGVKAALSSKEGSELFYSVVLGSTLGLGIMGYYNELNTKKDRSFVEDIIFKSTRDSLSMIGALDPKFIGSFAAPRLASFIVDLTTGIDNLLSMQKYKTTGELKGVAELKRTLTPTLISNLVKDKKTTTTTKTTTKKSTPRVKIPSRLPQLPSLEERLPKLQKLPKLKI